MHLITTVNKLDTMMRNKVTVWATLDRMSRKDLSKVSFEQKGNEWPLAELEEKTSKTSKGSEARKD